MSMLTPFAVLATTTASLPCLAQSSIDATNKFAWSENCGWMNWRDAGSPQASQGVAIDPSGRFLTGFIWAENIGAINMGDGSPANTLAYANTTASDFGVNIDIMTGELSGLAWSENVGWINFSGGAQAGPQFAARLTLHVPRRVVGYAWGENIGWINLSLADSGKHVAIAMGDACDSIDFNNDGLLPDALDLDDYITVIAGGPCSNEPNCNDIDFNNDGLFPDSQDLEAFLSRLSGGPCFS